MIRGDDNDNVIKPTRHFTIDEVENRRERAIGFYRYIEHFWTVESKRVTGVIIRRQADSK